MSDSRRQYRANKQDVRQLYPGKPQGNLARHLGTLVFTRTCGMGVTRWQHVFRKNVRFTAAAYGPVMVVTW